MRRERIRTLSRRIAKPPEKQIYCRLTFDPPTILRPAEDLSKTVKVADLEDVKRCRHSLGFLAGHGYITEFSALLSQFRLDPKAASMANIKSIWIAKKQADPPAEEGTK